MLHSNFHTFSSILDCLTAIYILGQIPRPPNCTRGFHTPLLIGLMNPSLSHIEQISYHFLSFELKHYLLPSGATCPCRAPQGELGQLVTKGIAVFRNSFNSVNFSSRASMSAYLTVFHVNVFITFVLNLNIG